MSNYSWYSQQIKPKWSPPAWLFGPVWSVLYILIAVSFGYVFWQAAVGSISWWLALPFILNLVFNFAFTPIQFRLRNNPLASIDILLTVGTLAWAMLVIWPVYPWVFYLQIPYLLWGCFATVLQLTITYLNRSGEKSKFKT